MDIKRQYLLGASLETLHFETREWIEEVRFWFDELIIFGDMVNQKIAYDNVENQIHKELELYLSSLLDRLFNSTLYELLKHEKYLSRVLSMNHTANEGAYRERHKTMAQNMIRLKKEIKEIKKRVFEFLEQKEFGLDYNFLI